MAGRLDLLKQQYFDLSREFLVALQEEKPSEELEAIRKKIREIVTEMELHESGGSATPSPQD